jgi:plastocyanin
MRDLARTRLAAAVIVVGLACLAAAGCGGDDDGGPGVEDAATDATADLSYTIPEGAGDAADAGRPLEILPARLEVEVGDVLEIVNEDERGHLVGPFFVGAQETLRQRFSSPGQYEGECTVHPSGQIVVIVT